MSTMNAPRYSTPTLERFGSLRDLTQGPLMPGMPLLQVQQCPTSSKAGPCQTS